MPEAYLDGSVLETLRQRAEEEFRDRLPGLRAEEAAVLEFLQQRLTQEASDRAA